MDIALGHFEVPALCIRRSDLLAVLISGFPQARVRLVYEFESLERRTSGAVVHFVAGGAEISMEHDVVIGADGLRSRVRPQVAGVHEPIYRGYTIWRGLARLRGAAPNGSNSETWGLGKRFGILNTGGDRFTWYAAANSECVHADAPDGRQRELLRMFAGWHEPVERLIAATEENTILKNGAYDLAPLKRWGQARITLLGDAAHPCTPNLGQGGCMALEDALVLAKSLSTEGSVEAALRRYESLRRQRTRHVQHRSLLMGNIGQWENRLMAAGRQVVTGMLPARLFERNLRRVYSYAA
jgi:2-polyprenyl-6-methoxyphenol hydroxylase-like FAD-dependent oxidoreductase